MWSVGSTEKKRLVSYRAACTAAASGTIAVTSSALAARHFDGFGLEGV